MKVTTARALAVAIFACLIPGYGRGASSDCASLVLRVVLVLDGLVFGQHPLMQNTGNQNAAGLLPVKHHMLALLHAPQARSNFITGATERGIVGKEFECNGRSGFDARCEWYKGRC
jgi:hypothetical protein